MIKLTQAIVVEGRYDKNTLSQIVDAPIFETNGFGIMHDKKLLDFLRSVAEKRGLIILTDPDGAGFVIRNFLKGALPKDKVLHAYVPDIFGKEKRKAHGGKEGKLGVEGMSPEVIQRALQMAGAQIENANESTRRITKTDLFLAGLSGSAGSSEKRKQLQAELKLPEHLGSNALIDALNIVMSYEEFVERFGVDDD